MKQKTLGHETIKRSFPNSTSSVLSRNGREEKHCFLDLAIFVFTFSCNCEIKNKRELSQPQVKMKCESTILPVVALLQPFFYFTWINIYISFLLLYI